MFFAILNQTTCNASGHTCSSGRSCLWISLDELYEKDTRTIVDTSEVLMKLIQLAFQTYCHKWLYGIDTSDFSILQIWVAFQISMLLIQVAVYTFYTKHSYLDPKGFIVETPTELIVYGFCYTNSSHMNIISLSIAKKH